MCAWEKYFEKSHHASQDPLLFDRTKRIFPKLPLESLSKKEKLCNGRAEEKRKSTWLIYKKLLLYSFVNSMAHVLRFEDLQPISDVMLLRFRFSFTGICQYDFYAIEKVQTDRRGHSSCRSLPKIAASFCISILESSMTRTSVWTDQPDEFDFLSDVSIFYFSHLVLENFRIWIKQK